MVNSFARRFGVALAGALCLFQTAPIQARAQVNVTTYHYDNYRTGWNQNETTLTQSNVSNSTFGLLTSISLDDQVDAQPLLVNGVTINGTQHNVVYVATENNSVYAIDAQSGQVLLQTNLGAPVQWPLGCVNNGPNLGINSTPVIDSATGTLYVIAYTLQNGTPAYYLHGLSIATLADAVTPVAVTASAPLSNGRTYQFNPANQRQRPGLLLVNNTIYAGFGSICDFNANDSRGWLLGWQESSLTPIGSNKLTNVRPKSPDSFFLSGIWMSGYGLAANPAGSVYFVTGNSDYSGTTYSRTKNISESAAQMSGDLTTLQSLFTPANRVDLEQSDGDFGSGGILLLPPQGGKFPDLAAAAGKDGYLYLLNADHLSRSFGGYNAGGCWCGPSYYQASDKSGRIVTSSGGTLGVWKVVGKGAPTLSSVSGYGGVAGGQDPGFFTSISSKGITAGSAIVWAVGRPVDNDPAYVDLYAINPDNGALLFSEIAGQWPNTGGNSNIVPVVANGLVYVASDQMLNIFGLGGSHKPHFPAIRLTDARAPLPHGQHEIYATVVSTKGSTIVARKRTGETVHINTKDAQTGFRYAAPAIGGALAAIGTFDKADVFNASTVRHAKDHPVMWPKDR